MLKDLVENMDNINEQAGGFSREMETSRKNQMAMVNIKNTVILMKNAFHELISRLAIAEERISDLEDNRNYPNQKHQEKKEREKSTPKQNRASRSSGAISRGLTF